MAYDGLITSFLGFGLASERAATPNIMPGAIALWFSTDSTELSCYANGAWIEDVSGTGGGMIGSNNLSEIVDASLARGNLGFSANGSSLVTAANYAAMKALLDLEIGTDIKAYAPSIQSVASSATVTPTFANDQVNITAQAAALDLANPTGTAVDGWGIAIRIKDDGTARAISYGTQYRAIGVVLPDTTAISKTLYLGMVFNNADTKWDVVAVAQEE